MDPTKAPYVACMELRSIVPQVIQKGKDLLATLPASQKTAACVLPYFVGITLTGSLAALAYGAFTFTAMPIVASIGLFVLAVSSTTIAVKIFGRLSQAHDYMLMEKLTPDVLKFVENPARILSTEEWQRLLNKFKIISDPKARQEIASLAVFVYTQIALNELHKDCLSNQDACAVKMREAAKEAFLLHEKYNIKLSDNHENVLKLLMSFALTPTEKNDNETIAEKANIYGQNRENIRKSLNNLNLYLIPMQDGLNKENNKMEIGLNTYLKDSIDKVK